MENKQIDIDFVYKYYAEKFGECNEILEDIDKAIIKLSKMLNKLTSKSFNNGWRLGTALFAGAVVGLAVHAFKQVKDAGVVSDTMLKIGGGLAVLGFVDYNHDTYEYKKMIDKATLEICDAIVDLEADRVKIKKLRDDYVRLYSEECLRLTAENVENKDKVD